MTSVIVAIREPRASELAAELELEGITVIATVDPWTRRFQDLLPEAETILMPSDRSILTSEVVASCDRAGVRILMLGDADSRALGRLGLTGVLPADAAGWQVAAALAAAPPGAPPVSIDAAPTTRRLIAVWGPHGAPGRSTIAIQLAAEFARLGRHAALVDADTVAPSLALLLGLSDDAPGIAAACRRGELGGLDSQELTRLATVFETSGGEIDVFPGVNRPSRWPELSAGRLSTALQACRDWGEDTIVDVAASFDADDEATYDVAGPRRHAATTATLRVADRIVAVASADPVGISRFLRDHAELRRLTAPTPITVVINRVRSGPLGIDARGQVRRTLERFAGIADVTFLPFDQRAADAALLHARAMADLTPRSPFVAGIRALAAAMTPTTSTTTAGSSRGSSRGARLLRSALGSRAASRDADDRGSAS